MATDIDGEPTGELPTSGTGRDGTYLVGVGLIIMLAGALFGYDQGVISGALTGIQKQCSVGTFLLDVITSWVTLGAMAEALVAGGLADRLGRRITILVAAVLFVMGALMECPAPGSAILVIGRLMVGFGVGVASVAAPLYASELSPSLLRGRMVSLYQLAITMGIFVAYFADCLLTKGNRWRLMLGISAIPAVLLFLAVLPLPDSPRWYVKVARDDEAKAALQKVEPGTDVDRQLQMMKDFNQEEAAGGRCSLRPGDVHWRSASRWLSASSSPASTRSSTTPTRSSRRPVLPLPQVRAWPRSGRSERSTW